MKTLSPMAISVPLAVHAGIAFGVWGFHSARAERIILPMLDILQTVPSFAYLLPILMLFGFGTVVGLIASVLYSLPPMVRNAIVGLRGVSAEIIESGLMSDATPRQLFWKVRVPSTLQQLLLRVNQTTMASLSMVIIALIVGGKTDIDNVSAIVRPLNDTLQTMPLFVLLIPFVMVFKIGEFTALLAIITYAILPATRYAGHGLRNLPEHVIGAVRLIGATNRQMPWQVKVPLAPPMMMLGLNQTIMYGIAMLVIAALVGTNGLEQIVCIGMSDGDLGVGFVAGIGMAIIAIITDRMAHAWSRKRQEELGLGVG